MNEYISKQYLLDAFAVFNDFEHGNEHFLNGFRTAEEIRKR